MIPIILIFLFTMPFISWVTLNFVNSGNIFQFYIFSFLLYSLIITFYFYLKGIDRNKYKYSNFHLKYYIITLLLIIILGYIHNIRWTLEPHGMDDAIVIWNQKAKVIFYNFINSQTIEFTRETWKLRSYPLGLPLSIAYLCIIVQKWSLLIPYFYVLLMSFVLLIINIKFIEETFNKKTKFLVYFLFFSFIFKTNYLLIQSDLCADYPLSLGICFFSYFLLQKKSYSTIFLNTLVLSWIFSLKDEGCVFSIFAFLLSIFIYIKGSSDKKLISLFIIGYLLMIAPTLYHKITVKEISYALSSGDKSIFDKIFNLDSLFIILNYFWRYHLANIYGVSFLITLIVLFNNHKTRIVYIILLYWVMIVIYNSTYFLSNLRLVEHLDTSYNRINYHFWMLLYLILIYNLKLRRKAFITFLNVKIKIV